MSEETVVEGVVETSEESTPEINQPVEEQSETQTEEPVDETGVPIKNRIAEAQRKARKIQEAEKVLSTPKSQPSSIPQDEAIALVKQLARDEAKAMYEPILARQFLFENPDAADMIDDIQRIRESNPELSGVDKLDLAYKVAKAERQDEIIRQRVEAESREREETLTKASRAGAEGTGKTRTTSATLDQQIANAGSLKELQELEALIAR